MVLRKAVTNYRHYAAHCVEIAHDISNPNREATLLSRATACLTLADLAERSGEPFRRVAQPHPQPDSDKETD